ncbi:unnamed protein product [Owenia fusiformis]|uniref:Uncharacterized protein n=1 Tax=Owenia fusiformis TaxID=6347 RepID=A0A8J1TYY4_OWEFU|nr:unnamed protein product [Owenia fusiformis]
MPMIYTRRDFILREKAMQTAKSTKDSGYGRCLLRTNVQEQRMLRTQLRVMDKEMHRKQMHINQQKKQFMQLRKKQHHEPTLIVERPPSPDQYHYGYEDDWDEDQYYTTYPSHNFKGPGYMQPLKTRAKTPVDFPTIDAFSVQVKKKKNVWEEALDETTTPSFRKTGICSPPLTEEERVDLYRGWLLHKPESRQKAKQQTRTPMYNTQFDVKSAIKLIEKRLYGSDYESSTLSRPTTPFLTLQDNEKRPTNIKKKTVTFSTPGVKSANSTSRANSTNTNKYTPVLAEYKPKSSHTPNLPDSVSHSPNDHVSGQSSQASHLPRLNKESGKRRTPSSTMTASYPLSATSVRAPPKSMRRSITTL